MKALKFLEPGAIGPYSDFRWPIPKGDEPGKWVSAKGDLIECKNGIHACTLDQAAEWLRSECYIIELGGKVIIGDDKIVARKGRLLYRTPLDERGLRLFAADCAEHVLHLFEAERPDDDRPRKAIETACAFANGNATNDELAAARDAARGAAWAAHGAAWAARDAARGAAWAAGDAAWAAGAAAGDAAWAAGAAAGDAAWGAAWAAGEPERRWQTQRLKRYLKLPKGWDE